MKFLVVALMSVMMLSCSFANPMSMPTDQPCLSLCQTQCGVASTICRTILPLAAQFCDVTMNFCGQSCTALCGVVDPKFAAVYASFSGGQAAAPAATGAPN